MTTPTPDERDAFGARPRPEPTETIHPQMIRELDAAGALDSLDSALRALRHATDTTSRALGQVEETTPPAEIHREWLASNHLQQHANALVLEHGHHLINAFKAMLRIG